MARKIQGIDFPVLLVEVDTTGVSLEDHVIHVVAVLVQQGQEGEVLVEDAYAGFQQPGRESTKEAFRAHGIGMGRLEGQSLDIQRLGDLVSRATSIVSRSPRFNAKKLHALVPECLDKRWYPYPYQIQNWRWEHFPASTRMSIMCGEAENDGYGRVHPLSELASIDARTYELVFGEGGPPEVSVKFGRRKNVGSFPEALLKCVVGDSYRFHGKEGYDFITAYCGSGDADRERAFRLATTPSNLELVGRSATLMRIDGPTYIIQED